MIIFYWFLLNDYKFKIKFIMFFRDEMRFNENFTISDQISNLDNFFTIL